MLRLAGCSSGRRDCARGVGLRERGGSHAGLCSSCAGRAILSECRVFVRAHHAFLSECRVFVRAHHAFLSECRVFVRAHHTFLSKCPAFDHACCLPPVRQTGRLALCSVPIPPWVVIAGSAFSNRRRGYPAFLVHFGLARFCMAIPTETVGTGERGERRERRTESAARQSVFLRDHIGFVVFSAGSPLGAARPQTCAKEPLALWTLFIWVVMWVRFTRRRALGYNGDLPNSNLWFGKSCGRIIAPMRASL